MNFSWLKKRVSFQQKPTNFYDNFNVGDRVRTHWLIQDGKKDRIQIFEGVVIAIKGTLNTKNFTLRKYSSEVGVEKIFFYNSPKLRKVELLTRGKVRRAKLYFLRALRGKAARIKEIKDRH